eukprot:2994275-Prymnesium_polylepis.2
MLFPLISGAVVICDTTPAVRPEDPDPEEPGPDCRGPGDPSLDFEPAAAFMKLLMPVTTSDTIPVTSALPGS